MLRLRLWTVLLVLVVGRPAVVLAAENIQVVVNAASPAHELSRASLRAIFAMRVRHWPDGTPITVFVLPDRDERHRAFCKSVLQVYPYVLRDTWDRLVFTGTGQAPIQVASPEELIRYVTLVRGAIGYSVQNGRTAHERIRPLEIRDTP